ncbi:MAG: T9SS type A sorting domain-containing protein [Saprospiraceae bacterium]|nr:T9SS type A sorting domain-containing protein [Saprospiraceae bacterium]
MDIVLNLDEGPNGEQFSPACEGVLNLWTAQGDFDALYFNIGTSDPAGGGTDCGSPITLGNNYSMAVSITGDINGDLIVDLTVKNNLGVTTYNTTTLATAGQSIIFTMCKTGFGCVENELIFGCCDLTGTLDPAPGAATTVCAGESTDLKITVGGGTAPYSATLRCESPTDTTYFTVVIPDDGDGDPLMDMLAFPVSPTTNCTYTLLSVVDQSCVEVITGETVLISVNNVTGGAIDSDQTICEGGNPAIIEETTASSGSGTVTYRWESSTTLDCETGFATIDGAEAITYDPPAGLTESTIYRRVTISTLNDVVCEAYSNCVTITTNPVPTVNPVVSQSYCAGSNVPSVVFTSDNPDAVFSWSRTNVAIGLGSTNGMGNIPSFTASNTGNAPLTSTFSVVATYTNNGVTCTSPPIQFTITVNPVPQVNAVPNQTFCSSVTVPPVTFSSSVTGVTFAWSRTNEAIGLAPTNGIGSVPSFTTTNAGTTPLTSTFSVVASYTNNGVLCTGTPIQFTITVNPTPTVDAVANQTYCAGAGVPPVVFTSTVPGATFEWSRTNEAIGLGANSGMGNIPSFTASNAGSSPITSTFSVVASYTNNGVTCTGTPLQFTITVNPVPQVNAVANLTYCNGVTAPAVTFSSSVSGVTYAWSRTNEAIGLAQTNGTGNVPSFNTTNAGTTPLTSTFSVVASYTNNGVNCTGTPIQFTITVNPTPTVAQPNNQVLCNGSSTVPVNFSGTVANTVFNWTNNTPSIGLATNGTGNIGVFTAINNSNAPVVATITVTPSFTNGGITCSGTPRTFTITVNPTPTVGTINNIAVCSGATIPQTMIGGPVSGTVYTWTNNNTSIGLAAGGTGNIPSFVAVNNTVNPVVATIIVIPTYTNAGVSCQGPQFTFTITVNPVPVANAGIDQFICLGATAQLNGSGGISCAWTPGTGLSNTGICDPFANPTVTTTYFLTVTNPYGCTDVDEVQVKVHVPVAMACNDNIQVSLNEDGIALILPDLILEGTYTEQFYTVMITTQTGVPVPNPVTCANVGQTLKVKVLDICNGNSCWGTIMVEDKLDPVLVCSDVFTNCAVTNLTPAYLDGVLGFANVYPNVTDNCEIETLTYADTWFDLNCDQTINGYSDISAYIRRVWTAEDPSGNQASCTQYIYVERIHVYDVSFPADITVSCENPSTDPSVTGSPFYVNPDFPGQIFPLHPGSTHCELNIVYADQILPICDGTYKILRTWTALDWCLPTSPFPPTTNPLYYIQLIKVEDNSGPVFVCPDDLTVSTNPFDCERDLNLPDVFIEDACSRIASIVAEYKINGITYTINGTLTDFPGNNHWDPDTLGVVGVASNLPLGSNDIKYIVTDNCGNSTVCTFEIYVEDGTPPTAVCDEYTQVSLGIDGTILVNASTFDDGSYDNCSTVEFKARRMDDNTCQGVDKFHDQVRFCCSDIGDTVTVIFRVYDVDVPSGDVDLDFEEDHSNDCMVQVLVDDKLKPVCQAPVNVTVSCENFDPSLWAYGTATAADNCCMDTITSVTVLTNFDTTCNKGTITRRWTAYDCAGQSSSCTQRVVVNYEQDYFVRFPNDKILYACDSTFFDQPTFFGEDCELLAVSYHDQLFTVVPDACYKIERTWTIINWCTYNPNLGCIYVPNPNPSSNVNSSLNLPGPIVSAPGTTGAWAPTVIRINPNDPATTNFSVFWDPNANCYQYKQLIKVIDSEDPVVTNCPASPVEICDITPNDPLFWNEMYWWDNTIGSHDLCEAPTDLTITATDGCGGENVNFRYLLFLDLDNSGDMETVVSSTNLPGYNNVQFNNANTPNYLGGTARAFDGRPVASNQKYGFALQTTTNLADKTKTASVRWNTLQSPANYQVPQLPYGTHKIKWIVEDGCGNETICEYMFTVKDCKAPTVVCLNGLSVNIMPTQMISLWASDFLQYTEDNCTPTDQIKIGIRRTGTGTGFPTNPDGTPQTGVTFTCADLGTQYVELWGVDVAGNADYCESYVIIQDNLGVCTTSSVTVAGALKTEDLVGLQNAEVELHATHPALPPINQLAMTDINGSYMFSNMVPINGSYTITPMKDIDYLNGVTTWDLVLINKHILGVESFNSPYKIIAADANNSKSVTTFDIAEIRKLILGIYDNLPQNTSWRFVDTDHIFINPDNPFVPAFPETNSMANVLTSQMDNGFMAMKVGDVNASASPTDMVSSDDRTSGTLLFDVEDRSVVAGEELTVNFKAAETVAGYQFTVTFKGLELLDLIPGDDMTLNHFGVFEDAVTTSFDANVQGAFTVKFRATKAGNLRSMLGVSSRITKAEAYSLGGDRMDVAFRFNGNMVQTAAFELYQNTPNPFVNKTVIGFFLPEAGEATLTIFDESGRLIYTQNGSFAKGNNAITIDRQQVNSTGLLYYKLESGDKNAVMKMIQTK